MARRFPSSGTGGGRADGAQPSVCHTGRRRQANAARSRSLSSARASRSGRTLAVRRSASSRRQRAIAPWSPESSTAGTSRPSSRRRAWCRRGLRAGRSVCESSASDSALPSTPGQQPGDRLDHHQHGHLAAGEHVVAEARPRRRAPSASRAPGGRCPRSGRRRRPATARPPAPRASAWVNGRPRASGPRRAGGPSAASPRRAPRPRARAASPCRGRRRTARRRPCGARRRGPGRAGRARARRAGRVRAPCRAARRRAGRGTRGRS